MRRIAVILVLLATSFFTLRVKSQSNTFYKKSIKPYGFSITASAGVDDKAMNTAAEIVEKMLERRKDLKDALIAEKVRIAVIATSEVTTDLPEHATLKPKEFWNKRSRGLASIDEKMCSVGEENLLESKTDVYLGESILVHEFAHIIHQVGLQKLDKDFDAQLKKAYELAMKEKTWENTYAATNYMEYWAEGVQSYFDTNLEAIPSNGIHNQVNTRDELKSYDLRLFHLIDKTFAQNSWRYR